MGWLSRWRRGPSRGHDPTQSVVDTGPVSGKYRRILPSDEARRALAERLGRGELERPVWQPWGADPVARCEHGRVALADVTTTLGGQQYLCLAEIDSIRSTADKVGAAARAGSTGGRRSGDLPLSSGTPADSKRCLTSSSITHSSI